MGLRRIQKISILGGKPTYNPSVRGGLGTPHYWLAFLNQVRQKFSSPQFTTNFEYKIDHISKTKNRKIVKLSAKSVSEHGTSFGMNFIFQTILRILIDQISKTKNRKNQIIEFPSFRNIAQFFG